MDKRVLDILCCPVSRQPLALLASRDLDALNRAISGGKLELADGTPFSQPLKAGLITRDRKRAYRIDDGIPVLLADESIITAQITDFPA